MNERFTKGRLYQLSRSPDVVHAEQGNRGRRICCTESMGDKAENEANARRIVATWNACAGISTEALETGPTMMEAYQREEDRADKAERERDELRTALEALVRDADSEPDTEYLKGAGKNRVAVHRNGIERARAALAANKEG